MQFVQKINTLVSNFDKAMVKIGELFRKMFSSDIFLQRLLISLILINLLTVLIYDGFSLFYNFDEYVVTTISVQPFPQFWNTLQSEPHPPGFYLILKFLSQFSPPFFWLKIVLKIISSSLFLVSIGYFYLQKNVFKKANLEWGFVFIFLSFNLLTILSSLKQDILTFPLFLLLFLVTLAEVISRDFSIKREVLLILILTSLFFLGYLNYFFALTWLCACKLSTLSMLSQKIKLKTLLYGIHVFLVLSYMITFGFIQWKTNQTRFSWVNDQTNSLFDSFGTHLTGLSLGNRITEVALLIIIFFILYAFLRKSTLFKENEKVFPRIFYLVTTVLVVFILISYKAHLFAQIRYSLPLFFLLSILAGWGARIFPKKELLVVVIIFLFCIRTAMYLRGNLIIQGATVGMITQISKHLDAKSYGLLGNSPSGLLYTKLQFFSTNQNLVPILLFHPGLYENARFFGKDQLFYMDRKLERSESEVVQYLRQERFTNYIYINTVGVDFYDPQQIVLGVLKNSCHYDTEIIPNTNLQIFYFTDCVFPEHGY